MDKIVYFEENDKQRCFIRLVKDYRKGGWFRKERVEYSFSYADSRVFCDEETLERVRVRIKRDFPNAVIHCTEPLDFLDKYGKNVFFVIAKMLDLDDDPCYYSGITMGKVDWTADLNDTEIYFNQADAEETAKRIRRAGERIFVLLVYLNVGNGLLEPNFMIVCTGKRGKQETKYFSMIDGNRIRVVNTSDKAKRMSYEEVLDTYEHLKTHNKNYLYTVLPAFKENVHYGRLEEYVKEKKISRMVQMTTKLKWLNK